jgi:hypothetical protein
MHCQGLPAKCNQGAEVMADLAGISAVKKRKGMAGWELEKEEAVKGAIRVLFMNQVIVIPVSKGQKAV